MYGKGPAVDDPIPAVLHRGVCVVVVADAILALELLASTRLAQQVQGRVGERALLVRPGRVKAVVEELVRLGHTPRVVGGIESSQPVRPAPPPKPKPVRQFTQKLPRKGSKAWKKLPGYVNYPRP